MYMVSRVDTNIPPTTAVPIAIRWLQPSPEAKASGINPRMVVLNPNGRLEPVNSYTICVRWQMYNC